MTYGARLSNSFHGEWELYVVTDRISLDWPEHSFGRTGPVPTVQERVDALAQLGYVLADGAVWEWQECSTGVMDRVELLASVDVQRKDGAA
ncbi:MULTISPECIES: DUF6303 family protein [unclassified Streptomyces]|uniref:DUF6303 family protein n=1 Tax=unclassified Streptomyces TaxID=2593676 RepID=UPI000F7388B4|nr:MULTISPECIES: DUF6303 family protein [unclassified Streptomyces]MBQ0881820.1 hypothetical protein [Streptomyces sp. RT42]RSS61027.1 hypothetical protein EF907_34825 [Streptomyces sp. WAC06273]